MTATVTAYRAVSGSSRRAEGSRIGRFGLKATAASLADQTADAAMLDMGLSSPLRPQPFGDCTQGQTQCRANATGRSPDLDGEEISRSMVEMVAKYVSALPPKPVPANPQGERLLERDRLRLLPRAEPQGGIG